MHIANQFFAFLEQSGDGFVRMEEYQVYVFRCAHGVFYGLLVHKYTLLILISNKKVSFLIIIYTYKVSNQVAGWMNLFIGIPFPFQKSGGSISLSAKNSLSLYEVKQ